MGDKSAESKQDNVPDALGTGIQVNKDTTFVKQLAMMPDTKNETAISRDNYGGNRAEKDYGKGASGGPGPASSKVISQKPPPIAPKPKHILSGNSPSTSSRCSRDISSLELLSPEVKLTNTPPVVPGLYLFDGHSFTLQGEADFASTGTIVYGGSDYCIVTGRSNRPDVTTDSDSSSDDDIKLTPTMSNLRTLNINIKLDLAHLLEQQTTKSKRSKRYQRSRKGYEEGGHYEVPDRFSRDLGVASRVAPRSSNAPAREKMRGESREMPDCHAEQVPPLPSKDYLKKSEDGTSDRQYTEAQKQSDKSSSDEKEEIYETYTYNPAEEGGDSSAVRPFRRMPLYDEPDFSAYRCYESDTHIQREIQALINRRIDWFVIYSDAETAISKLQHKQNNCFVVVAEDVNQKPLHPFTLHVKVGEGKIIELPVMKVKTSKPPPKYRLLDGKQKKCIFDLVSYYQKQPLPSLNITLQNQTK